MKLPPQDVELERELIGCLINIPSSYDKIKEIMKVEYFYDEHLSWIYSAIQQVVERGGGVTLMSVIQILRENDRIGQDKILPSQVAEIHAESTLNTNVEYNSRILIELYIKRVIINDANLSHNDAYDPTTDAILNLEDSIRRLETLKNKVFKPKRDQEIKKMWEQHHITQQPAENPFLLYVSGVPVVRAGGQMLIIGKKKSRKTLFTILVIKEYLDASKSNGDDVLVFDTEQARHHVWRLREKVHQMTGKWINVFSLVGLSPQERLNMIEDTCKFWPTPPQVIISDGTRDLMRNINDPEETTDIMTWSQQQIKEPRQGQQFSPCLIHILHLNKADSNPRGHIGTELQNKAECTVELTLDEKSGCTDVKCESSREKPFSAFSFTHDQNEMPMLINAGAAGGEPTTANDKRQRLLDVYADVEDGMLSRKELEQKIKEHFKIGANKAGQEIQEFKRLGWIITIGKYKSPTQKYKIMINDTTTPVQPRSNGQDHSLFDDEFPPPDLDSEHSEIKIPQHPPVKSPAEPKFDDSDLPF